MPRWCWCCMLRVWLRFPGASGCLERSNANPRPRKGRGKPAKATSHEPPSDYILFFLLSHIPRVPRGLQGIGPYQSPYRGQSSSRKCFCPLSPLQSVSLIRRFISNSKSNADELRADFQLQAEEKKPYHSCLMTGMSIRSFAICPLNLVSFWQLQEQ